MSIKLMTKAWELDIKSNDKLVLLALADHANDDGECYPSNKKIAEKCGLSRQGLIGIIDRLIELGYVKKEVRIRENKSQTSNLYILNLDPVNVIDPVNVVDGGGQRGLQGGVNVVDGWGQRGLHLNEPSLNHQIEPSVEDIPQTPKAEIVAVDEIPYQEIIDHLNGILGSDFKHSSQKTRSLIKARWDEGYREDDFFYVHTVKFYEWEKDEKMAKFLRPETLYSNKFEGYRNQKLPKRMQGEMMQKQIQAQGFSNVFDYLNSLDNHKAIGIVA